MYTKSILFVCVEFVTAQFNISHWERTGFSVHVSETFDEGLKELLRSSFNMLIVDSRLDSEAAIKLCRAAKATNPSIKLAVIISESQAAPSDFAVDALFIRSRVAVQERRIGNTHV